MPGLENWHTIEANYGNIKRFYGALCSHFTPENTTCITRISLDFRVIVGCMWDQDHDQFTKTPGYYTAAQKKIRTRKEEKEIRHITWERIEAMRMPDYRVSNDSFVRFVIIIVNALRYSFFVSTFIIHCIRY